MIIVIMIVYVLIYFRSFSLMPFAIKAPTFHSRCNCQFVIVKRTTNRNAITISGTGLLEEFARLL